MALASATFVLTQTPDFPMSGSAANTHIEEVWNFAGLPGWDPGFVIQNLADHREVQPYRYQLSGAEFFLFTARGVTGTKSATCTVPAQIPIAHLSNGGVKGQFDTRVGRNSGTFQLHSVTITLTVLTALGLAAALCFARRRA